MNAITYISAHGETINKPLIKSIQDDLLLFFIDNKENYIEKYSIIMDKISTINLILFCPVGINCPINTRSFNARRPSVNLKPKSLYNPRGLAASTFIHDLFKACLRLQTSILLTKIIIRCYLLDILISKLEDIYLEIDKTEPFDLKNYIPDADYDKTVINGGKSIIKNWDKILPIMREVNKKFGFTEERISILKARAEECSQKYDKNIPTIIDNISLPNMIDKSYQLFETNGPTGNKDGIFFSPGDAMISHEKNIEQLMSQSINNSRTIKKLEKSLLNVIDGEIVDNIPRHFLSLYLYVIEELKESPTLSLTIIASIIRNLNSPQITIFDVSCSGGCNYNPEMSIADPSPVDTSQIAIAFTPSETPSSIKLNVKTPRSAREHHHKMYGGNKKTIRKQKIKKTRKTKR